MSEKKPLILVAEDDLAIAHMISKMLAQDAVVETAADGSEALARLKRAPRPDLLITDLMMPGVDGLSLVRTMKDESELSSIPVIMLTAKGEPGDMIRGINAGARHYLTKPFRHQDLIAKVKRALPRTKSK